MKVFLVSTALFAIVLAETPAAPPAYRPSGRLLLLPARQEAYPAPAEYSPSTTSQPQVNTTQAPQESESDESQPQRLLDSGEYYVLLADGRLQMVKYTTAALTEETDKKSEQVKQAEPFAQFQIEYVQFPFAAPQYSQTQQRYTKPQPEKVQQPQPAQTNTEEKKQDDEGSDFEANIQYRNVKPISAPIYAHNPAPLIRILKK